MKKFNRNYISLYEYLISLPKMLGIAKPDFEQPRDYSVHGFRYHDGSNEKALIDFSSDIFKNRTFPLYQLLGALRPFAKIYQDIIKTGQPYYSSGKFSRDIFMPFRGIGNILQGMGSLIGGSLLFIGWLLLTPLACVTAFIPLLNMAMGFPFLARGIYPVSWVIEGGANIIRGITQIVASLPPIYYSRIFLRIVLTAVCPKKFAEEKPEIRRLATEASQTLKNVNDHAIVGKRTGKTQEERQSSVDAIQAAMDKNRKCNNTRRKVAALLFEINRKYEKSINQGWKTSLNYEQVKSTYQSAFSIFKERADDTSVTQQPEDISIETINVTREYINNFSPSLLKS